MLKPKYINRIVILLVLVLGFVVGLDPGEKAQAAACSTTTITVSQESASEFVIDNSAAALDSAYVAYKINAGASGSFSDLWIKAESFSDLTKLNLATYEDGLYHVGPLANNAETYVYFYLNGVETNVAQSYTLNLYEGSPTFGGTSTCTQSVSHSKVGDELEAAANKVTSVVHTAPYIGGTMTITVSGETGVMSSSRTEGSWFSYTPASKDAWPADCYELYDTNVVMTGGNTLTDDDGLIFYPPNTSNTSYVATYYFTAACSTATPTSVTPVNYISSGGTNLKHTDTGGTYASIPPVPPAENRLYLTKSVSPGGSAGGGTATYTVNVYNTAPIAVSLDIFQDILPSSPANATYIASSSTFNGLGIPDPYISGQQLTWTGNYDVPANSSKTLTYQATIPANAGMYTNSVVGFVGNTQIDQTLDSSDNVPATVTYGVGDPNLSTSTKTVLDLNGGEVKPGDVLRYTVTVNNGGTINSTGVDVTDTIDTDTEALTNVIVGALSTNCGGSYSNSSTATQLIVNDVAIIAGSSCAITFDVNIKASAADNAAILNTANISTSNEGGVGGTAVSNPLSVQLTPNLVITKTENDVDNFVTASQNVTYTITIDNTGEANATGVDVIDTITGAVSTVGTFTLTNCGSTYTNSSSGLIIDIANVDVSMATNCVITYIATVNPAATNGQTINNSADVGVANQGGNDPAIVSATTLTVGTPPVPNLAVTKAENDGDNIVVPGQTVTYTVTITNSGTGTGTTSFTDAIDTDLGSPSNFNYTNCGTPSQNFVAPTLTVSSLTVTTTNSCVVTFDVVVDNPSTEGATIPNSVDVAAASEGGNNPAAVAATTLTVNVTPDLSTSTKTENDANDIVTPGQTVTYTITIINTGDGSSTGSNVTDTVDTDTAIQTGTVSLTNCGTFTNSTTSTQLIIIGVDVAVATNCVITFDVVVGSPKNEGTVINNTASITAAVEGGTGATPSSPNLTVDATPNLVVTKTENDVDNFVTPGQVIGYTITVQNTGNGQATGVSLSDSIDSDATLDTGSIVLSSCGSPSDSSTASSLSLSSITIAASGTCTITFNMAVGGAVANSETIPNSVDVSAATEGGNNPALASATTLTVQALPNLVVTKTENDADNIVTPGQTVTYTVTIDNTGTGTATTTFTNAIDTDFGAPSNFSYTNCGTPSENFVAPTLTVSSVTVTTSNDCVMTYDVVVDNPNVDGTTITNSVDVAQATEGGNNPANVNATMLTVNVTPNLGTSTKTENDADNSVTPGQTVTYTITTINTGDGPATGVNVTDTVSIHSTIQTGTVSLTNCGTFTNNTTTTQLNIVGVDINIGTSCVVTFDVVITTPLNEGTVINNTASITAAVEGGSGATPSSSNLTVDASPNLVVTKAENDVDNIVTPGQVIGYTITIQNTGTGTATTMFSDTIDTNYSSPSNFTYTNCGTPNNNFTAPTLTVSSLTITLAGNCLVTYDVTVNVPNIEGATLTNSVDVAQSSQGGNDPAPVAATPLTYDANDGVDDQVEDNVPNGGDGNNDGINDSTQPDITSFINPVTNGYAVLENSEQCINRNVSQVSQSSLTAVDGSFVYPVGLMNFELVCGVPGMTTTVTQYYYGNINSNNLIARKYSPSTDTYKTIAGAVITNEVIGGRAVIKITYQITDGGEYDEDGVANGTIVDPAGPAVLGQLAGTGVNIINYQLVGLLLIISSLIISRIPTKKIYS